MHGFTAAFRREVRRLASREAARARQATQALRRRLSRVRSEMRAQRSAIAALQRRLARLTAETGPRAKGGARVSAEGIRALRAQLRMTRAQFARLLAVSPGSVFGWESGRTIPRGRSMERLLEVRKMGVRRARRLLSSGRALPRARAA